MNENNGIIAPFFTGLIAGVSVLAIELTFFVGNILMDALKPLATSPQSEQILTTYSTTITLFIISGVLINIIIGYYAPATFSLGYITGDFLMIASLATALMQIAPSVLTGMVIAFVAILLGLFLKIILKNKENRYRQYDYWG